MQELEAPRYVRGKSKRGLKREHLASSWCKEQSDPRFPPQSAQSAEGGGSLFRQITAETLGSDTVEGGTHSWGRKWGRAATFRKQINWGKLYTPNRVPNFLTHEGSQNAGQPRCYSLSRQILSGKSHCLQGKDLQALTSKCPQWKKRGLSVGSP